MVNLDIVGYQIKNDLGVGIMASLLDKEERSISYYGLLIVLSLLALYNGGINHNIIYWSFFIVIIIIACYAYKNNLKLDFHFSNPLLWYLIFCLWSGLSIFWSISPHWTVVEFLKLITYGAVFILARKLKTRERKKLIEIISLLALGTVCIGILKYLFVSQGRMQSTFYNSNPYGLFIAMVFSLIWGLEMRSNKQLNFKAIILLIGLFLSGSRGSILALVLAMPLLFIGLKKEELHQGLIKTGIIIVLALILVQGIVITAPYLQESFANKGLENILIRSEGFMSSSVGGRLAFWKKAVSLFRDQPIKGYGLGSYHIASYLKYDGGVWYSRFVHNHYLQVLSELGVVGLVLFLLFLFFLFKIVLEKIRLQDEMNYLAGIITACTVFLIHISFDFTWNFSAVTGLFFAVGGMISCKKDKEREQKVAVKKLYLIIVVVLLIIGIAPFISKKMSNKGYQLLLNENFNNANNYYKLAAKIYPLNPKTYYFTSKNYLNLFNRSGNSHYLKQSLKEIKQAVKLSPINGQYHNHLGMIYWKLGEHNKAEEHLLLGVEYGSYLVERYLDLGYFYYKRERFNSALSTLREALELKEAALVAAHKSYKEERKKEVIKSLINVNSLLAKIHKEKDNNRKYKKRVQEIEELKEKIEEINNI
ncbi:MAG: O-antigen ligase family protein [Halanaerobacter sp.]